MVVRKTLSSIPIYSAPTSVPCGATNQGGMAPPPPELMAELVEEIILRFPPDDPASLVRAALVCKLWCRFVCGAAFRRRFREFHHGAAPLLGVIYNGDCEVKPYRTPRGPGGCIKLVHMVPLPISYFVFVPTASFRLAHAAARRKRWSAVDARHGRVLLRRNDRVSDGHGNFSVWDPVTDEQLDLPKPPFYLHVWSAAVACAATASSDCDHLDCRGGPFLVLIMDIRHNSMYSSIYSSDAGAWRKVTVVNCERPSIHIGPFNRFNNMPGVLVRSALYFLVQCTNAMVKYDLATQDISMIPLPSQVLHLKGSIVLMIDDDGELGFVAIAKYKLKLWSKVAGPDADAAFVQSRVIDLRKVLPSDALVKKKTQLKAFADSGSSRFLFISTPDGLYSMEINSSQVKKVANCCGNKNIIPYISFCTPTTRLSSRMCLQG